jgi:copper resistance protein C
MSMLKTLLVGAVLSVGWGASFTLSAHPKLLSSIPADGAQGVAPVVIELHFSENLLTQFSGAKLSMTAMPGMAHAPMPVKASVAASSDPKVMLIKPASLLAPGSYRVDWRAVSSDTHPILGNVVFSVQP